MLLTNFTGAQCNRVGILYANLLYESFYSHVAHSNPFLQMGTCAMKARGQGGVVDERLNVYGVQNLKVAGNYLPLFLWKNTLIHIRISLDCSIAPDNVGANTYNTAIAIGEKAAVIIAEDLDIKGVTSE